ncbi:hypothetical protein B0H14DRAFT_2607524 [Mycena olivaceomarginata]|nr:hypothetical protein B0H14DRAFT_2607524 [Mycena olivaceomarginata]
MPLVLPLLLHTEGEAALLQRVLMSEGDAGEEGGEGHVESTVAEPCRYRCDAQVSRMTEGEQHCVVWQGEEWVWGQRVEIQIVPDAKREGAQGAGCGTTMGRDVDGAGAVRALVAKGGVMAEGQQPFSLDGERRVRIGKRKTANEEWWSGDRERRGWEEERKARSTQNVVREEGECTGHASMCIGRNHEQVGKERWMMCCGKGDKMWTDGVALQKSIGCTGGGGLCHGDRMRRLRGVEAAGWNGMGWDGTGRDGRGGTDAGGSAGAGDANTVVGGGSGLA